MHDTIKPCPHCGGAAYLNSNYSPRLKSYMVYVRCDVCGAQGRIYNDDTEPAAQDWQTEAAYSAVEAWNLRTYHELEAAKQALKDQNKQEAIIQ